MAIVVIAPGEKLVVQFDDMDGEFEIHCDTKEHKNAIVVKETGGFTANVVGSANQIMHLESFENRRRSQHEMALALHPHKEWNNAKRKKGGDAHKFDKEIADATHDALVKVHKKKARD